MTNAPEISPERMKTLLSLSDEALSEELRNRLDPLTMFGVADPAGEGYLFVRFGGAPEHGTTLEALIGGVGLRHGMDLYSDTFDKDRIRDHLSLQAMARVSHISRKGLASFDAKIYDELGYQPPASNRWPLFRSFRPGCSPAALLPKDLERLITVMEQAKVLADRVPSEPWLHEPVRGNQHLLLVRVPERAESGEIRWVDQWWEPELAEYTRLPVVDEVRAQRVVKDLPQNAELEWEADAFFGPVTVEKSPALSEDHRVFSRVGEEEELSSIGRLVAICDPRKEEVLKLAVFSLERSWGELQELLLDAIEDAQERPRYLAVIRPDVYSSLFNLCEGLDIELFTPERLPASEAVQSYVKQQGSDLFRSENS
ncbi:MAG: DUF6930 domain-containing protein [Candidatus Hydrogenedentota bacterium]